MKNIINYYAAIFFPITTLVLLTAAGLVSANAFVTLLLIYALIYHPFVSGLRLIANNKINKGELWKNFIPFWNLKYFSFLFFNADVK
ncbi:MAG: hypothetical protein HYR66_08830 [Sphingobacteriales bacterium]|nr:hypothetical protein [Sphingobacteriales bacterium]MBI3720808.1 hypothetical protein [Sphingobacteriales bacterium]